MESSSLCLLHSNEIIRRVFYQQVDEFYLKAERKEIRTTIRLMRDNRVLCCLYQYLPPDWILGRESSAPTAPPEVIRIGSIPPNTEANLSVGPRCRGAQWVSNPLKLLHRQLCCRYTMGTMLYHLIHSQVLCH